MRLINCSSLDSLRLEQFEDSSTPKYAILSHTWEKNTVSGKTSEVTFEDFEPSGDRRTVENAFGWDKIEGACKAAQTFDKNIQFLWVDSCCIDKKNGAELAEAINSMFQWYAHSTVCLTYLCDVDNVTLEPKAKWFSRGWTLQELVASSKIRFYNKKWHLIGDKRSLSHELAEITVVDRNLLEAENKHEIVRRLARIPVCQKMSWMSKRQTTKIEDTAYCLLGIFDIHMPLLYGEGEAAFIRLQEQITIKYNDLTVFAWSSTTTDVQAHNPRNVVCSNTTRKQVGEGVTGSDYDLQESFHGIFACSPMEFEHCGNITSRVSHPSIYNPEFSITNKGLKMSSALQETDTFGFHLLPLMCHDRASRGAENRSIGILLKWVGGSTFARHTTFFVDEYSGHRHSFGLRRVNLDFSQAQDDLYLAINLEHFDHLQSDLYRHSLRLPHSIEMDPRTLRQEKPLELIKVSPGAMWDDDNGIFVTFGHQNPVGCASYSRGGSKESLFMIIFGADHNGNPWQCLVGDDSPMWPSHVERRREYLTRIAIDARKSAQGTLTVPFKRAGSSAGSQIKVQTTFRSGSHEQSTVYDLVINVSEAGPIEAVPKAHSSGHQPVELPEGPALSTNAMILDKVSELKHRPTSPEADARLRERSNADLKGPSISSPDTRHTSSAASTVVVQVVPKITVSVDTETIFDVLESETIFNVLESETCRSGSTVLNLRRRSQTKNREAKKGESSRARQLENYRQNHSTPPTKKERRPDGNAGTGGDSERTLPWGNTEDTPQLDLAELKETSGRPGNFPRVRKWKGVPITRTTGD